MQNANYQVNTYYCGTLAPKKHNRLPDSPQAIWLMVLVLLATTSAGCQLCRKRNEWCAPRLAVPQHHGAFMREGTFVAGEDRRTVADQGQSHALQAMVLCRDPESALHLAESAYERADASSRRADARCIDAYYEALVFSWVCIDGCRLWAKADALTMRAWDLYHSSLAQLITLGPLYGRLNPQTGLSICAPSGPIMVPLTLHGFPWKPTDFNHLICVGQYRIKNIVHEYRTCGLGVPIVVVRNQSPCPGPFEAFYLKQTPFSATAFLSPDVEQWLGGSTIGKRDGHVGAHLNLYDPLRTKTLHCAGESFALASDITASLGYLGQETNWNPLLEFIKPETDPTLAGLRMLEPYQPGKIPLIFVHGLFSDPQTYLAMANHIRACPDLDDRYQIWMFRYPTGGAVLQSAATLRTQMKALISLCRSCNNNPQLDQIVMVGHSLGGLVTKLQITDSQTIVWASISRRPLDQIAASDRQRAALAEEFFFVASPSIKSVIFIATPQKGSPYASRPLSRLTSTMVKYSPQMTAEHRQLINDNPNTFAPVMRRKISTSIDLLQPDDPILLAIQKLPIDPCVSLHSIIGTGGSCLSMMGESDGIVPVTSAQQPGSVSVMYVDAIHTDILRNEVAIAEVERILRAHARHIRPREAGKHSQR